MVAIGRRLITFCAAQSCVLCGAPSAAARPGLCADCRDALPVPDAPADCPPGIDRLHCALHWSRAVARLVGALKYDGRIEHAQLLGGLLAARIRQAGAMAAASGDVHGDAPVLVPVPLGRERLATRGYNQSECIARVVAASLTLELRGGLVVRARETRPQTRLPHRLRQRNVRSAFRLVAGAAMPGYIALIDDVVATGSTAGALAAVLRAGGARRVELWAVACVRRRTGSRARCR